MSATVVDRIRALGRRTTKSQRWAIGATVRERWVELHGKLPDKLLRTKTSARGSHCLAVYPASFEPEIDAIIERFCLAAESQKKLFPEEE